MSASDPQSDSAGQTIGRLSVERLAALLRAAGSTTATEAAIRADIAAGAPVHEDGTMSLLAYGAWLLRELALKEGGRGN